MKSEDCLVSVIVPIYNVEKYVAQCIESIQRQTHKNLDILLVDDGSTDFSGAIAETFSKADNRIRVLHKENGGVSSARNLGIEYSMGEYICFVDGDDYVAEDYVSFMLDLAVSKDADLVIAPCAMSTFNAKQTERQYVEELAPEKALERMLCYHFMIGCYSKLFKRSFLGENIRFFENLVIGEGFNFNILAIQNARNIIVGHRKIYFYRRDNATSVTTKFNRSKFENGIWAIDVIKNNLTIQSNRINRAWKYAYWRTCSDTYDAIVLAHAEKECSDLYRKCLRTVISHAYVSFFVPISHKDRLRALVMMFCPRLIPWAMVQRRKKYHAEV